MSQQSALYPYIPSEQVIFNNVASTPPSFQLKGGQYGVTVHAGTWSSGSVGVQRLAADTTSFVACMTAFTADGYATFNVPPGTFQLAVTSATSIWADVASIVHGDVS